MSVLARLFVVLCCIGSVCCILCFNCSVTHTVFSQCAGDFAPTHGRFNASKRLLTNCSGENAMCFVRSWSARSRHAWIVQRGCYYSTKDDPLPMAMNNPTRSMSCHHRRLADAEYKVCLCQADWCNSAPIHDLFHNRILTRIISILFMCTCHFVL